MTPQHRCVADPTCGCLDPGRPQPIHNRPGMQTIRRRIGVFASFRTRILREVGEVVSALAVEAATEPRPLGMVAVASPLERWTARTSDDIGVALVEAAAVQLDILTFYQERIANEAYLRTAQESDSIEEILSLLGYLLSPPVTAVTHLAFDIEPDRTVTVPAWSQVQSVPADGELPQTFETIEPLTASGILSRMHPTPPSTRFRGTTTTLRPAGDPTVRVGDTVLVGGEDSAEERRVVGVDGPEVRLDRPIRQDDDTRLWVVHDSARGYGGDLPHSAVHTYLDDGGSWASRTVKRPPASSGSTVYLDRALKPNDLVHNIAVRRPDGGWAIHRLRSASVAQWGEGPLEKSVTAVMTGAPPRLRRKVPRPGAAFGALLAMRAPAPSAGPIVGHGDPVELVGGALRLDQDVPAPTLPAGTTQLTVPTTNLAGLRPGRTIIMTDRRGVHLAEVLEVDAARHRFELQPGLPRPFDAVTTVIFGNVAEARHGERHADQALGDGDPTVESQEFPLRRGPLAWRLDGLSPQGASPEIEVRVDGVAWTWVSRRTIDPSDEPRFAIATQGKESRVQTGRAAGGVVAKRGKRNVAADYRVGGGVEGNVPAGSLSTALDRPPGLRSVSNPLAAQGGSDRESPDHARAAAPAGLRATGRVVALPDFEYAALDFPGVAKAHATWVWGDGRQLLHLTVAGEGGSELSPLALSELHRFLDRQRDDRRPLRIDNHVSVPIRLRLEVTADERVDPDVVVDGVIEAIEGVVGFDRVDLGQSVDASSLTERLHRIDAVLGVRWLELSRGTIRRSIGISVASRLPYSLRRTATARRGRFDPMPRVAIRGAASVGSYAVRPAELARVSVARRDVVVRSTPRPEPLS